MLARLRSWAGHGAVFIMIIPYCMIHFPKTWSESVGAVIAGIVLGALAASRSLHLGGRIPPLLRGALTMDILSLYPFRKTTEFDWGLSAPHHLAEVKSHIQDKVSLDQQ